MGHILKVKHFMYNGVLVGVVGMDLATGDIKQYSSLDNDCKFGEDDLHFIDLGSMPNCTLKTWITDNKIKRYDDSETLPYDLKPYIHYYTGLHREHNTINGYSNQEIDFNSRCLEMNFKERVSDSACFGVLGDYVCPSNVVNILINRSYDSLDLVQKKLIKDALLHELGHMKVTKSVLDLEKLKLYNTVGFYNFTSTLKPVCEIDGNIIYEKVLVDKDEYFLALEEAFNELECKQINSDYIYQYAIYGPILNSLSEGMLVKARHEYDSDQYFRVMMNLIDDEALARDTLKYMYLGLERDKKEEQAKAFTLLKKYEDTKRNKE